MEEKIPLLFLSLAFLLTLSMAISGFVLADTEKEIVIIECYDNYNNEMLDIKCEEEKYVGLSEFEESLIEARGFSTFTAVLVFIGVILAFVVIK